ncbi:MAG: hypothetical protein AAGF23_01170, partial [Acidobacteriota bacterium]
MDRTPPKWLFGALLGSTLLAAPALPEDPRTAFPVLGEHFFIETCDARACSRGSDLSAEQIEEIRRHVEDVERVVQTSDEVLEWLDDLGLKEAHLERVQGRFHIRWHGLSGEFKCRSDSVIACVPVNARTGLPLAFVLNRKNIDFDGTGEDASTVLAHEISHLFTLASKETLWLTEAYSTAFEYAWTRRKGLPFAGLPLDLDVPFNSAHDPAEIKGYERFHYLYSLGEAANSPEGVGYLAAFADHFDAGPTRGMGYLYDRVPEGFSFPEYFPKYVSNLNSLDSDFYREVLDFRQQPIVHLRDETTTYRFEEDGGARVPVFAAKAIHLRDVRVETLSDAPEKSRLAVATLELVGGDPDLSLAFEDRLGRVHSYGVLGGIPGQPRPFDGGLARVIYAPENLRSAPAVEKPFELDFTVTPLDPEIPACVKKGTSFPVFTGAAEPAAPSNMTLLVDGREVEGWSATAERIGPMRLELRLDDPLSRDVDSRGGGQKMWPALVELGVADVVREDCMIRMIGLGETPSEAAVVTHVPSRGFTVFSSRDEEGGAYL